MYYLKGGAIFERLWDIWKAVRYLKGCEMYGPHVPMLSCDVGCYKWRCKRLPLSTARVICTYLNLLPSSINARRQALSIKARWAEVTLLFRPPLYSHERAFGRDNPKTRKSIMKTKYFREIKRWTKISPVCPVAFLCCVACISENIVHYNSVCNEDLPEWPYLLVVDDRYAQHDQM